ncbi:MAG: ASPIC/UnbV domain-containing protein, partial [Candidatus Fermentibacteraceae bacterium]|nr:ASPIC/UnbV domain-containing protein [Candidatus Fermentibacteraceae bacterium]
NDGRANFRKTDNALPAETSAGSRVVAADYDGDGDIDAFLATHFGNRLLRCDGMENNWLVLQLTGTISNRNAIGTVVRCMCNGVTTYARVDGGHGMGDYDSRAVEFGLGSSGESADIEILWPSGIVESFGGLGPGIYLDIMEDEGLGLEESPGVPAGRPAITCIWPNPAAGHCSLRFVPGELRGPVMVSIMDISGRLVWERTCEAEQGVMAIDLPAQSLSPGLFIVQISSSSGEDYARFIVTR